MITYISHKWIKKTLFLTVKRRIWFFFWKTETWVSDKPQFVSFWTRIDDGANAFDSIDFDLLAYKLTKLANNIGLITGI